MNETEVDVGGMGGLAGEFLLGSHIMFYAVKPSDFMFSEVDKVPDLVARAVPYFIAMIAVEWITGLLVFKVNLYKTTDLISSLLLGMTQQTLAVWTGFLHVASYEFLHRKCALWDVSHDSWWAWYGCLLGVDCGYYFLHRYAHAYHLLWCAHSVHHSGETYNLATALRQGMLQSVYGHFFYLPLAVIGLPPAMYLTHSALNTLYQFWIHTDLVGSMGPLELVLNTPSHHRMHHRPPGNCNYGGVLIIWDRIFGTWKPEDARQDYYGLALQAPTMDPVLANVLHFTRMSNIPLKGPGLLKYLQLPFKCRAAHGYGMSLAALFAPMETVSKTSLWAFPKDGPKRAKVVGGPMSWAKCAFVWVAFTAVLACWYGILVSKNSMAVETKALATVLMFIYASSLAQLNNGRSVKLDLAFGAVLLVIGGLLADTFVLKTLDGDTRTATSLGGLAAWAALLVHAERQGPAAKEPLKQKQK